MRLSASKSSASSFYSGLGEQLYDLSGARPALDLNFASNGSLVDSVTGESLITFTRASSGTYVDGDGIIQTADNNVARFDHNPTTGESLGLLVEESRTNLLHYSTDFDDSYWLQTHITTNAVTGPDGTTTAATYEGTGAAASVYNVTSATVTASTQYTYSIYIKLGTMSASNYKFAVYDVSNSSFVGADLNPNVTPTTTGWTRISYSFTTPSGCTAIRVYPFRNGSSITSSTVHFWGAQLEAGSFPTSYIRTEGSTVTRSADVTSITGTNFSSWYSQTEGTVFSNCRLTYQNSIGGTTHYQFSDGTTSERFEVFGRANGGTGFRLLDGGTELTNVSPTSNSIAANTAIKIAVALKENDIAAESFDDKGLQTDNSVTLPTVDRLDIGDGATITSPLNGTISRLTYWPTRLSNDTLQTITR